MTQRLAPRKSKGQTLIIVALMFVMLMGFVGLVIDIGRVFIEMGHLRRAVDAAALAAASQFREGRDVSEMTAIAREVMYLNNVIPTSITVDDCTTDFSLCTTIPPRKFVHVTAGTQVNMTFLLLLGLESLPISSDAVGEAASLDVVMVIDISESMVWDAPANDPMRDPKACNDADPGGADGYPGECEPFEHVKAAADRFVQRILDKPSAEEEDRLAIVTFATGWSSNHDLGTHLRTAGWTNVSANARNIVSNLKVAEPGECYYEDGSLKTFWGPCRSYDISGGFYGDYQGFECLSCRDAGDGPDPHEDWSTYTTTNIGGGLLTAGNMFAYQSRPDALWVVILLTDGMANATFMDAGDIFDNFLTYPIGYCPNGDQNAVFPICQDHDVNSRHRVSDPLNPPANYDADDYARDMADFVGCMPVNSAPGCNGMAGQGALIFAVGLGSGVLDDGCRPGYPGRCEVGPDGDPFSAGDARPYGASLMRYVASVGEDGDPASDELCDGVAYDTWCGNYYFGATGSQLDDIFEDIASRIFTRIHQ